MYLKRVEIQGFKSFADKIDLDFNQGITAIVGPNGSGKSNISDAIRWVMGEQSIKSLRGSKMEDVIFSGTEARKPQGFAEVSLTIDNSQKIFPLDFDEITVLRRVYRSGESEYQINKTPCRLKDIHELFMDTGLGREGYSVIGQGKIDEILSNKSEDRRHIFEEAAGITKYKYRKNEAEKKLSSTTENLTRVYDILKELEIQVEPLKEQSEKAKRFLNLREELKNLDLKVSVLNIRKSRKELDTIDEAYKAISFDIDILQNNIETIENSINSMYDEAAEVEKLTEEYREEEKLSVEKVNDYSNRINILIANSEHEKENILRIKSDIEKSVGSGKYLDEMLLEYKARIDKINEEKDDMENRLSQNQKDFDEKDTAYKKLVKSLDDLNAQISNKNNAQISSREKISAAKFLLQSYNLRRENIENELKSKDEDFKSFEEKFSELSLKKEEKARELSDKRKKNDEKRLEYDELNSSIKSFTEKKHSINSIINQKISKRIILEELENELEGYGKSVKSIMSAYTNGEILGVSLHGPLSQLIHTNREYVTAIDVALQNAGQNIVCDTEKDAKKAIEYLKRTQKGRVTFLPISTVKPRKVDVAEVSSEKGFLSLASELIVCDKQYNDIISSVLGAVIVADNIDNAVSIARKTEHKMMVVTLQGELIRPGGAITGGSFAKSSGFLSRLSEIEELKIQEENLKKELSDAENELNQAGEKAADILKELNILSESVSKINEEYIKISADFDNQSAFYNTLKSGKENLEFEVNKINDEIKLTNQSITDAEEIIRLSTEFIESSKDRVSVLNEDIKQMEKEIDLQRNQLLELNISLSNLIKDIEHNIERMNDISAQRENVDNVNREREIEISNHNARIEEIKAQIEAFEEAKENINKNSENANKKILELVDKKRSISDEIRNKQEQAKEKREQLFKLSQQKSKLESKKNRFELELDSVFERLWEDYEITYSEAEEYFDENEEINISASERRISALKSEIKGLGNINIDAIEGYKNVKERFDFLTLQTEDLEKSKKELEGIILELLSVMQKQFKEQFAVINKNFNSVFKELFGGGSAKLELSDPENLLESGIEIEAQPPGKKLQSLTLLSGGERAFTATALLFAILNVRPTPFCILDEIEAALDDVNVYRFADYLKKYSEKTQFIVVTHRRGTMEAANILYGVTMQERGVSKLLSLNIDEVTE